MKIVQLIQNAKVVELARRGAKVRVRTEWTGSRWLEGTARNITDRRGRFVTEVDEETCLWLTTMVEHFIPLGEIVAIEEVEK